jgi:hypothetical protein
MNKRFHPAAAEPRRALRVTTLYRDWVAQLEARVGARPPRGCAVSPGGANVILGSPQFLRSKRTAKPPRSLSDLLMNTISSSGNFIGMAGICLDRLLKQRSALRKPDFSFDLPPQRGVLTQKTQFDTEVTEASRRGTERCIGVVASAVFLLIAYLVQIFEQKATKRTKRVMFVGNRSSLPSFSSVKVRKDRLVGFNRQGNSILPRRDPEIFLCDLLFVLSGLCDEIGLRILGLRSLSGGAVCLAAATTNKLRTLSQSPTNS